MRVVFDSNVIIAAFATHGLCHSLFELCIQGHQIIIGDVILGEVNRKLLRKIKVPAPIARDILSFLKKHCILGRPVPVPKDACRDPKDLAILGLAVASRADGLVTGDADLLVLKRYHETAIVTPRQLYERLRLKKS
ncbi:MAG: putative toxin-antitoxin system toxin component, PIN family [Elusimicrobia bacterium]|nr:putative toxin-antitoxin system toxin component, PIN family [Elusimicrobiota bacterium]